MDSKDEVGSLCMSGSVSLHARRVPLGIQKKSPVNPIFQFRGQYPGPKLETELIGGRGGGGLNIHIFAFCPTNFF